MSQLQQCSFVVKLSGHIRHKHLEPISWEFFDNDVNQVLRMTSFKTSGIIMLNVGSVGKTSATFIKLTFSTSQTCIIGYHKRA